MGQSPSEASEEQALEDSAYQSHHGQPHQGDSKDTSTASFTRFPSEESLGSRYYSASPSLEEKSPVEWYAEYSNQSFHSVTTGRIEYTRSRSQFDAHIAEIKGKGF